MQRSMFVGLALLASAISCNAHAWSYVEVNSHGVTHYFDKPPVDLTYPPDNVAMPVVEAGDRSPPRGTPITASQERRRRSGETLIIVDGPMSRGSDDWVIGGKEQPLH